MAKAYANVIMAYTGKVGSNHGLMPYADDMVEGGRVGGICLFILCSPFTQSVMDFVFICLMLKFLLFFFV